MDNLNYCCEAMNPWNKNSITEASGKHNAVVSLHAAGGDAG
jgi:hypothetical protein